MKRVAVPLRETEAVKVCIAITFFVAFLCIYIEQDVQLRKG